MRHLKRGRKLNRTSSHKKAMLRNMVSSLFTHGKITTTPAKAKEARPFAEQMITLAKQGDLAARRRAISLLHDKDLVAVLFKEVGARYANRQGGYCRILHLGRRRLGDNAQLAILELVEAEMKEKKAKKAPRAAVAAPAAGEGEKKA